jgi:Tfp pilus assembly protein PilZ
MMAPDPTMGKSNITVRLFKLVNDMPMDQQLLLLKQLVGDRVSAHLYKLIVEMTEEQQTILLEQIGQLPKAELPEKMVSLEETEASMRGQLRKQCLLNTNYRIQDRNFKSYILDVSIGGVFIETNEVFPKGKDLLLKFSLPDQSQPFTLSGKIAWSSSKGFGVEFDDVSPLQGDMLKSFIGQND